MNGVLAAAHPTLTFGHDPSGWQGDLGSADNAGAAHVMHDICALV